LKRKLFGEHSQSAKGGVIFHSTEVIAISNNSLIFMQCPSYQLQSCLLLDPKIARKVIAG
jgi:hypothetical protein